MALRLITPPEVEPITLEQAKQHLRFPVNDEDDLIQAYIEAARIDAERWMQRAIITQTWELVIDGFNTETGDTEIQIPLPPLQEVLSIKYDDGDGNEQTVNPNEYYVDTASEPGWVVPVTAVGWPSTLDAINTVRIRFVAGWPGSDDSPSDLRANVPRNVIAAIMLRMGQFFAHRENVVVGTVATPLPQGFEHLLRMHRLALGMA